MSDQHNTTPKLRVILSGGGTGGHIYPAVSVAEALRKILGENLQLLFVGAEGKMEMQKIPALGYRIVGLPIAGLQRRLTLKNLAVPFKLILSMHRSKQILRDFKPDVVVGFGGYASGPILRTAQRCGIPTLLWEGNSYAGMANKMLAQRAQKICVAYQNMGKFFPQEKIVLTGNPLRGSFQNITKKSPEALTHFGFDAPRPTLFVTGGSLGTRTLNQSVLNFIDQIIAERQVNLIWQTGAFYLGEMQAKMQAKLQGKTAPNLWYGAFIDRMDLAYSTADVTISRAGACTISELSLVGAPTIFVPSPNVAEDHQTKNAQALVEKGAALLINDSEAPQKVIPEALRILKSPQELERISQQISILATPNAASDMANLIIAAGRKS